MTDLEKRALDKQGLTTEIDDVLKYGISYMQHLESLDYMETVARNACVEGMSFLGVKVPTPMEHYRKSTTSGKVAEVRLDVTDMFPIELNFKYRGSPFTVYPYLPDVGVGNIMRINGTRLVIKPIITTVFTGTSNGVLTKTLSNKVTIRSLPRLLKISNDQGDGVVNDQIKEIGMCHCEHLPNTATMPTAVHIIYNYGLSKFNLKIIKPGDWDGKGDLITNQAMQNNPIAVVIDKDRIDDQKDYDESLQLAAGILYLGLVHSNILLELDGVNTQSIFATIHQMRINGKISRRGDTIELSKSIKEIEAIKYDTINQIRSMDDPIRIQRLRAEGYDVDNYTDILRTVTSNYSKLYVIGKTSNVYLDSMYYTLYNISSALYKGTKQLNTTGNQGGYDRGFKSDTLNKRFRNVNKNTVYNLAGSKKNLTVEPLKGATDSKYYLATSYMDDQNRGEGVYKAQRSNPMYSFSVVKAEDTDLSDIHWATRSHNSSTARVNLCAWLKEDNGYRVIAKDENYNKLLNEILN